MRKRGTTAFMQPGGKRDPRENALVWIDPAAPAEIPLAPLTRDHVLPLASRRGVAGNA